MRSEIKGLTIAQGPPQDAPRRNKASKLGPTWPLEASQNRFEIDQNSILGAQGGSKATQDPPKIPNRSQIDPKSIQKIFKVFATFLLCWGAMMPSPLKPFSNRVPAKACIEVNCEKMLTALRSQPNHPDSPQNSEKIIVLTAWRSPLNHLDSPPKQCAWPNLKI